MNSKNPYSLDRIWSEETLSAYKSMPLYHRYTVALDYVKPKDVTAMEGQWREWCRVTPRNLWPLWIPGWPERKAMRERE